MTKSGKNVQIWQKWHNLAKSGKNGTIWQKWQNLAQIGKIPPKWQILSKMENVQWGRLGPLIVLNILGCTLRRSQFGRSCVQLCILKKRVRREMTKKQITRDADQKWEEMGTKRAPGQLT